MCLLSLDAADLSLGFVNIRSPILIITNEGQMSVYEDYIKKFPEVNDSSLTDIMIKDGVVSGRKKSVRDRLARLKRKMIESTKREDRYIFNLPGKTTEIPNEAVEVLFRRYTSSKTTVDDCKIGSASCSEREMII